MSILFSNRSMVVFSLLLALVASNVRAESATRIFNNNADIDWNFWGMVREESFAGKNLIYLNNNTPNDQVFYLRHTWDTSARIGYGLETFGSRVAEFKTAIRQRTIWGFSGSTARTAEASVKIGDVTFGDHSHELPRLFIWMREGWLKFNVNEALRLGFSGTHNIQVGAFPFELGRGIALGAAYAVGPTPLGFYSDSVIDQFAFGILLSGEIVKERLKYDLYGAILQSRSSSLSDTSKRVLLQELGRYDCPERGFGKDSYVIATRLFWNVFSGDKGTLIFEPYVMYNNDPEQKIEFPADASLNLASWGLAGEYEQRKFGCGFDMAFNMGRQTVKAWDRNQAKIDTRDGYVILVNSKVLVENAVNDLSQEGKKVPYVLGSDAQKAIVQSARVNASPSQNNELIIPGGHIDGNVGFVTGPLDLYNDVRFRREYHNIFNGMMFVTDASYWVYKKDLQVATTFGYASGDNDPNFLVEDGTFDGFIGLQEIYQGKRVKSVFLLGTVGKLKRPGVEPTETEIREFSQSVSGFTNIIFWGSGFTWKPCESCRLLTINPNMFLYWEPVPGKKFDAKTMKDLRARARPFLGTEFNVFTSAFLFNSLKVFGIASLFLPGGHYKDIKGKPTDTEQAKRLKKFNEGIFSQEAVPNIGDSKGFTINVGLEYTF